jgi:hypothetical protein
MIIAPKSMHSYDSVSGRRAQYLLS